MVLPGGHPQSHLWEELSLAEDGIPGGEKSGGLELGHRRKVSCLGTHLRDFPPLSVALLPSPDWPDCPCALWGRRREVCF